MSTKLERDAYTEGYSSIEDYLGISKGLEKEDEIFQTMSMMFGRLNDALKTLNNYIRYADEDIDTSEIESAIGDIDFAIYDADDLKSAVEDYTYAAQEWKANFENLYEKNN